MEVARRRIAVAELTLVHLAAEADRQLTDHGIPATEATEAKETQAALLSARARWGKRVDAYCRQQDKLSRMAEEEYGQVSRYPPGVDSGQNYSDCLIAEEEEWARELESFAADQNKSRDGLQKIRIRGRLMNFLNGKSPLFANRVGRAR
jgi:hypothetical protein